jgi:hypothetical protein
VSDINGGIKCKNKEYPSLISFLPLTKSKDPKPNKAGETGQPLNKQTEAWRTAFPMLAAELLIFRLIRLKESAPCIFLHIINPFLLAFYFTIAL